ncbi:MAG TPA: DUF2894 domain-containing protein [Ideonella sp.]|nr:DUF2894 domain-containing protein [Ideonella sp.]
MSDPGAAIVVLRARGAQGVDPVRFRYIEALARRASAHEGEARRILDGKLAQALSDYAARFEQARPEPRETPASPRHPGPLADLVRHIAQHSPDKGSGGPADGAAEAGSPAELKTLRYFRSTWSQLSADLRMSQSVAKVPENAGPLNSHGLALRSLQLMRDLSPAYLNRFMSYLDALLWLDQASGGNAPVPKDVVHGGEGDKPRKAGRKKP